MSSLAQMWVDSPMMPRSRGVQQTLMAGRVAEWLTHRLDPRNPRKDQLAERFSFDDCDPGALSLEIRRTGRVSGRVMAMTTRLPADCVWLEWHPDDDEGRVGYLAENASAGKISIVVVLQIRDSACPVMVMELDVEHLSDAGGPRGTLWWCDAQDRSAAELQRDMRAFAWELMGALFLINTPRVSEFREHVPSAKLQRRRDKAGKPPLLEIRKVKVVIGRPTVRYERSPGGAAPSPDDESHRRLHQVIGHFRTYVKRHGDSPRVAWVPAHWRGDASLGVILHDRHVVGEK